MRMLYVTATMPYGTGEAFLIPEVREILRRGWELLIVPRTPPREIVHRDTAAFQEFCVVRPLLSWDILLSATAELLCHPIRATAALRVLLRSRDLATLVKNLAVYPKGLWLGRLSRRWRADHIHAHWVSTPATLALVASTVSGVPWSCTAHRADIAMNNLLASKLSNAKFVRFISESGRTMAVSLGARVLKKKTPVIHVGVVLPDADSQVGTLDHGCNLLCPGNLYPVKGHVHLLRAMAILRGRGVACVLHIAGRGELRPELEAMVRDLDLADTVRFLGQLSHDEILAAHERHRFDIVVLPSIDLGNNLHEGIPVVLVEAMSYGIPVVATSTGGIPELLCDGAGIMVPPQDPTALAVAIERLMTDSVLRRETAEAGRRRVRTAWSVESVVSDLMAHIAGPNEETD